MIGYLLQAAAAGAIALGVGFSLNWHSGPKPSNLPGATVRIVVGDDGIGSGVHIGNGFILTAAHVAQDAKTLRFQTDARATFYDATVLWVNKDNDLALVRSDFNHMREAKPACRTAAIGEPVETIGNLMGLRFFHSRGYVATLPDRMDRWQAVYTIASASGMGMSGGAVLAADGALLGITVAGFGPVGPMAFVVPATTICTMLGRVQ